MRSDAHSSLPATRRRVLGFLAGALAVSASARVLRDEVHDGARRAADAHAVVGERRYRGTATDVVGDADAAGDRRSTARPVAVRVTPATADATPFELVVDADPDDATDFGPRLRTVPTAADSAGRPATDRYWDVETEADGTVTGVLRRPADEANALSSRRELVPGRSGTALRVVEPMASGTTLTGTVTPTRVDLLVSGTTVDRFAENFYDARPFLTRVRATRTDDS